MSSVLAPLPLSMGGLFPSLVFGGGPDVLDAAWHSRLHSMVPQMLEPHEPTCQRLLSHSCISIVEESRIGQGTRNIVDAKDHGNASCLHTLQIAALLGNHLPSLEIRKIESSPSISFGMSSKISFPCSLFWPTKFTRTGSLFWMKSAHLVHLPHWSSKRTVVVDFAAMIHLQESNSGF